MTYNKHIFDIQNKKIIKDFESAYKNFDNVYPTQFEINSPKFSLVIDKLRHLEKKTKILDIGAGYGVFIDHLKNLGIDAIGVEISSTAIEKGKNLYGNDLNLVLGDLEKGLNFSQESFDLIVCYGVMNYLLNSADDCLKEIKRLLTPQGYLAISLGFKEDHIFFKEIVSSENDFLKLISKYFLIEDFFVHYHEIGTRETQSQNDDLSSQARDFIIFARNKAA